MTSSSAFCPDDEVAASILAAIREERPDLAAILQTGVNLRPVSEGGEA